MNLAPTVSSQTVEQSSSSNAESSSPSEIAPSIVPVSVNSTVTSAVEATASPLPSSTEETILEEFANAGNETKVSLRLSYLSSKVICYVPI